MIDEATAELSLEPNTHLVVFAPAPRFVRCPQVADLLELQSFIRGFFVQLRRLRSTTRYISSNAVRRHHYWYRYQLGMPTGYTNIITPEDHRNRWCLGLVHCIV